jgi:exosortase A
VSQSTLAAAPATTNIGRWAWHLGALGAVIVAILAMFPYEVANAVVVWWFYPAYSHCYLIIPISAWLVWRKRAELAPLMPIVAPKALFIFPFLILVWLGGVFATINEVRQFSVVAMIVAAIATILGPKVFRVVLFPALYLFFLVPFGQYFIPPMQEVTTLFTDVALNLIGVPHFTEGTIIELPNGRFEIADACAGLRFLTAAIALGVLFVQITYTKWWKSAAFLGGCVIVPLIANGLRCAGTMALAYWTNDFQTVADNHITAGFIFNTIIILAMFWVASMFRDPEPKPQRSVQTEFRSGQVSGPMIAAAIILLLATGPVLVYWQDDQSATPSTLAFPRLGDGWSVLPPSQSWEPVYPVPDQKLDNQIARLDQRASAVDVKVFYYTRIQKKTSLISSKNALWDGAVWHGIESHNVVANLGKQPVGFDENIVKGTSESRIIWSSYWLNGQFTNSALKVKLLQVKGIALRSEGTALITVSTPIDGTVEQARARLRAALTGLENLRENLNAAGHAKQSPAASN